jgi:hypothetical protein
MRRQVLLEAVVVGVVTALAFTLKSAFVHENTLASSLAYNFMIGVAIHMGFELAGANAWYCKFGAACTN